MTGIYALYRVLQAPRFCFVPVVLNFTVHAVMYSYYFLMALKKLNVVPAFAKRLIGLVCESIAIFITAMQLSQMAIALLAYPLFANTIEPEFGLDVFGLSMYVIYFIYFAMLFAGKYIFKTHKAGKAKDE